VNSNINSVLVSNLNLYRSWLNSLNKIFPRVISPRESPRETTFTRWQRLYAWDGGELYPDLSLETSFLGKEELPTVSQETVGQ